MLIITEECKLNLSFLVSRRICWNWTLALYSKIISDIYMLLAKAHLVSQLRTYNTEPLKIHKLYLNQIKYFFPQQTPWKLWGNGFTAALILKFGTGWKSVASLALRPISLRKESQINFMKYKFILIIGFYYLFIISEINNNE